MCSGSGFNQECEVSQSTESLVASFQAALQIPLDRHRPLSRVASFGLVSDQWVQGTWPKPPGLHSPTCAVDCGDLPTAFKETYFAHAIREETEFKLLVIVLGPGQNGRSGCTCDKLFLGPIGVILYVYSHYVYICTYIYIYIYNRGSRFEPKWQVAGLRHGGTRSIFGASVLVHAAVVIWRASGCGPKPL